MGQKCSNCGFESINESKFCQNCGVEIIEENPNDINHNSGTRVSKQPIATKAIIGVVGICCIGIIVLFALIAILPDETSNNNFDDTNTLDGVKFNTPVGFTLNSSSDSSIYFVKGDSEINVKYVVTDMGSAKEYVNDDGGYYSVMKIGDLTFYKKSMWKINLSDIDLDNFDPSGIPEDKTDYSEYFFDFKGKIFSISIDDDISNHEKLLKEIIGI